MSENARTVEDVFGSKRADLRGELVLGRWLVTELLGMGNYGTVWRAEHRGESVAVKHFASECAPRSLCEHEATIHSLVHSPYVARYIDADPAEHVLVREYVAGPQFGSVVARTLSSDQWQRLVAAPSTAAWSAIVAAGYFPGDAVDENWILSDRGVVLIDVGLCRGPYVAP
jgi:serine/threonine protein kinase